MKGTYNDQTIPFGKHVGELVADVPNGYLAWLADQEFVEEKYPELWDTILQEVEYRDKFGIKI